MIRLSNESQIEAMKMWLLYKVSTCFILLRAAVAFLAHKTSTNIVQTHEIPPSPYPLIPLDNNNSATSFCQPACYDFLSMNMCGYFLLLLFTRVDRRLIGGSCWPRAAERRDVVLPLLCFCFSSLACVYRVIDRPREELLQFSIRMIFTDHFCAAWKRGQGRGLWHAWNPELSNFSLFVNFETVMGL